MPKKPSKNNPECPLCKNKNTISGGFRKNKNRTIKKFHCKSCQKYFTLQPNLQKHKTYPINLILNTISNLNLGYSLKQTKNFYKKIPRSTLSYWYNQLKTKLPYHRLRTIIKTNYKPTEIIKKTKFIHHKQPFTYQYHKPKLDLFLKKIPQLQNYLENIQTLLPKNIFNNSKRISEIAKSITPSIMARASQGLPPTGWRVSRRLSEAIIIDGVSSLKLKTNYPLTKKQNYATTLANIALQITKDNKQRHNIIENFMLKNDTATIAVEIPIYLTKNITGHIDILQVRYHKLHILDFKPIINKQQATTQLYLYAKALSNITKIPLKKFKCAFFNDKNYYEFSL